MTAKIIKEIGHKNRIHESIEIANRDRKLQAQIANPVHVSLG